MSIFKVRIDACFNYDVEADNPDQAQGIAEDLFELDTGESYSHTTETLVFEEDGVTIANDEDYDA